MSIYGFISSVMVPVDISLCTSPHSVVMEQKMGSYHDATKLVLRPL